MADPSLRPPKKWFDGMYEDIEQSNPGYTPDQVRKTIGSIWAGLDDPKKAEIRGREGKTLNNPGNARPYWVKVYDGDEIIETKHFKTEKQAQDYWEKTIRQYGMEAEWGGGSENETPPGPSDPVKDKAREIKKAVKQIPDVTDKVINDLNNFVDEWDKWFWG